MFLRYNTATEIDFFMPDDSDPWSGKTGLTSITVQYKKQGQDEFTTLSSPTITEIGNGWYKLSVPTTLVDTYGFLVIRFSASGAKSQQQQYQVVAFNPYDSNMGLSNLDVAVSSRLPNGNVTVGGYASGLSPAEQVLSTPANKLLTDSNGHVTVATNNDKSGYSLQTSEHTAIASSVWSATTRTLSSLGNSLVDEIWHRLRSASNPPDGSFGYYLDEQVSSVGGGTSDWTATEREQIRYVLGIDGTKTAPTGNTGWIPDMRSKTQQLTFTGSNINANISSYSSGLSPGEQVLSTPTFKIVTDSAGHVGIISDQADSISSTAASLVWSTAVSSLTGANTIGKRIVDYLDTTVSSRSTLTTADVRAASMQALTDQGYTTTRAAKLDNLDVAVSSRLASADYTAPPGTASIANAVWSYTTRELTALSSSVALSIWHVPTTSITAAGTVGLQVKDNLDTAVSTRSTLTTGDVHSSTTQALTDLGYTSTRAARLDNIDATISSRLAQSSYVAPPSTSDIATAVWSDSSRVITGMDPAAAVAVWHVPATGITADGSIGLQVKTNIDATVSSRSVLTTGDVKSASQQALTDQGYTPVRAGYLDRLDVAVSTRLASADYSTASIADAVWSYATRELTSLSTDLAVSVWHVPATSVTASNTIGLQLKQNVDAAISSRLAASAYVAPDNAGISSIWNKVQNLSYTQQGSDYYVNAYTINPGSIDYNQVATSVWSAETSPDYGAGSFGNLVKANVDAPVSSRLASGDYTAPPAATAVASAVWSYSTRELTAIPASQAVAVWNVAATALTGTGTVGKRVVDNMDAPVSSRSTLTASDVWAYSTRELTALSTGLAVSVWNVPSASVSAANSIGLHVKGSLDVPVSTRLAASSYVAPDNATIGSIWSKVQNLSYTQQDSDYYVNAYTTNPGSVDYNQVATSVWSAASGTNYGSGAMGTLIKSNLDASVSSRLAESSYTAPPTTSDIAAAVWGYSDRQITDISSAAALAVWHVPAVSITAANTIGLQLKTNVDAAISTRLSASSYVAPDNAGISNIWSKVQNLSYTQYGSDYYVNAYTTNPGSVDYNQVATSVWSAATSSGYGTGSFGELVKTNIDAAISSRLASSGYTAPPTTADISSAVWTHSDRQLTQISPSVAVGVWNVATTSLTGTGTIGQQLKDNVDVAVSTRSTLTFSDVQSAVSDIGYTAARAAKLDYLDAPISSRSTLTASQVWTYNDRQLTALSTGLALSVWNVETSSATGIGTIGKRVVDNLDAAVSSRSTLGESGVLNALNSQGYTSARASRLDNLDATVSSRLATSAFSPTGIAEAVWNTQRGASRAYDTFGFYLDARISSISGGGGGGGGGFYGPYDVTLQFVDENNNPVSGVVFFVEGMGGAVAPGGSITINLPGGNFIVRAIGAGSVLFSPTAISVTGSGYFQIRGARVSVPVPTSRNSVVLHYLLSDDRGNPLPNTDLTVTILDLPVGADRSVWNVGQTWTVSSNSNGVAVLPELPVSALVELTAMVGMRQIRVTLRVPRIQQ
jgi:hypothetical protein